MEIHTSCSQHLTVRAQAAVEDTGLVSRNLHVTNQGRVAPDAQGVVREAAGADNLTVVVAPLQAGDLRAGVDTVGPSAGGRVPEVDVTVVGTTTRREQIQLPRAPAEGLDGSTVVRLGELGCAERPRIPDVDQVVIAASGELSAIGPPFQSTHLRGVRDKLSNLVLGNANVVVENKATAGAGRQGVLRPSHDSHASVMAKHAPQLRAFLNVPDLDFTRSQADTDVGAIPTPLDTADVCVWRRLEKAVDSSGVGRPHVDVALKTNGDLVARAPIQKVEIVVV